MEKQQPATLTDYLRKLSEAPLNRIGKTLARLGIHPDLITITGLILVVIAAVMLANGLFLVGSIVLLLSLPMDAVDGAVARATQRKSVFVSMI